MNSAAPMAEPDLPKSRKAIARRVAESDRFKAQIERLSERLGRSVASVSREALVGLEEIAAVQSPLYAAAFDFGQIGRAHV